MADYTAAQYTAAINAALKASDVKAVHGLLTLMALDHPREADVVRRIALIGCELAEDDA